MKACARCGFDSIFFRFGSVLDSEQSLETVCVLDHGHIGQEEVDVFSVFGEHGHDVRVKACALGLVVGRLLLSCLIICFHDIFSPFGLLFLRMFFYFHPLRPGARGENKKRALWRRRPRLILSPKAKGSDRLAWHESLLD